MLDLKAKIEESAGFIRQRTNEQPQVALVLGSGLGGLAERIEKKTVIPYGEIPNFPELTVTGHTGNLICGTLSGKNVIVMQGRFHYYEGYVPKTIALPVWIFKELGVGTLIVTSAVGALNRSCDLGGLSVITDHINMTGTNPLIGPNDDSIGARFPDMSEAYNEELIKIAEEVASQEKIKICKGVYVGVAGPSYETPAEVKFLQMIGGDVVGMSTVPEVIVAAHAQLRVLGISCVTDAISSKAAHKLTHEEVLANAGKAVPHFCRLVEGIIKRL
jgi:purine-nucleoside phosphorylase